MIADGVACAVLPYGTVTREVKAGILVARRIINPDVTRTLYLLQRRGSSASVNARYAEAVTEQSAEILLMNPA
ncbi:hypothetical protein AGR2A_pb10084 [Agrobacterium genomosp. 2 str. CFBP 5494]|uniref:Uncharacterized protein n=1 Tax=Agrobacterium genomosp. 2 str. CFBP 5494 TaxID=1183436 RepID=A0A9W5B7Q5_9HYPH|nr:hypothetical protein AGR2A_pb10084 [Agrobacterium genomosp. 2 str. CFBP 5494]